MRGVLKQRGRRIAKFISLAIFVLGVGVAGVHKVPDVFAACGTFLCPNGGSWDVLAVSTTPGAGQVAAGNGIAVQLQYTVNKTYSGNVDAWIDVDIADGQWGGGWTGHSGSGGNAGNPQSCPSWWYDTGSHYWSQLEADHAGSSWMNGAFAGDPYTGKSPDWPDEVGYTTCGQQGHAIVWSNAGKVAGNTYTYNASFTVNPDTLDSTPFCVRGYVALDYQSKVYARSNKECFHVNKITIGGSVGSSPNYATGKYFDSTWIKSNIEYSRDGGANWHHIGDNSNSSVSDGFFSFYGTAGQQFTLRGPTNTAFQNTSYSVEYGPPSPDSCSNDCYDKNFLYDPAPQTPAVSKSSPEDGVSLKPGDQVHYTVVATNDQDANQPGVTIADEIPLNIDPGSVSVDGVTIEPYGAYKPGTWSSTTTGGAMGMNGGGPQLLFYGFGNNHRTQYYVEKAGGGGGRYNVRVRFTDSGSGAWGEARMPAYTKITINWHGSIRSRNNIGIYPGYPGNGDFSYCANEPGVNYDDVNSVRSHCETLPTGYQGVSNTAATAIAWPSNNFVRSNTTYSPIPGGLACVDKTTTSRFIPDSAGPVVSDTTCNGRSVGRPGTGYYDYSPGVPGFDPTNFDVQVNADTTKGPVIYSVNDQDTGALANIFGTPYNYNYAAANVGGQVQFSAYDSRNGDSKNFSFAVPFTNAGAVGAVSTNTANACYVQYWLANHAVACVNSNTLQFKKVNVLAPYITGNGDVRSGTGVEVGANRTCDSNSYTVLDLINGAGGNLYGGRNGGGNGKYAVLALGSTNLYSRGNYAQPNYGLSCQPDLVRSAQTVMDRGQKVPFTGMANQAAYNGKVAYVTGNVTIPASTITGRWTLYATGRVNITGTGINYASGAAALKDTPSFGVISDGGIFIDKDVQNLDGYYYTSKRLNTCESPGGATLGSGYTAAQCNGQLKVNGLLMAASFRFNRTYVSAVNGAGGVRTQNTDYTFASEYTNMLGQLFAATPPAFSDVASEYNAPTYLPERAPRY